MSVNLFVRRAVSMCTLSAILFAPNINAEGREKGGDRAVERAERAERENNREVTRESVGREGEGVNREVASGHQKPEGPAMSESQAQKDFDRNMKNAAKAHEILEKEKQEGTQKEPRLNLGKDISIGVGYPPEVNIRVPFP